MLDFIKRLFGRLPPAVELAAAAPEPEPKTDLEALEAHLHELEAKIAELKAQQRQAIAQRKALLEGGVTVQGQVLEVNTGV
jgi:DNA-directed RNA polymerase specialized sigma24 family protein